MYQFSPKQKLAFLESDAKINIWEGAVRSGKTYSSIWRFCKELSEGPDGEYAVIARTYDSFKRNVFPIIDGLLGTSAHHYSGKRELVVFGKTVHIIGADDERAEAKIKGPTFAGAYVDEASIIPEGVFMMLISRCMMGGAKIFATTNPDSPFHWLKKNFLEGNPDVKSWQFRLDDNPVLREADKEYIRRQYKGLWYQRYIEGMWVQAEGSIYDMFEEKLHVMDYGQHDPEYYVVGVDYGTNNPCVFELIGIKRSGYPNIWVEDEYYYSSKDKQRQKTDSEYAEDLGHFVRGKNVRAIYIDPSAASFKTEIRKMNIGNVVDANHEVIDGIRFVANLLNNGTLKITRKCKHLIAEFQSYVWDPKASQRGVERPLKENDHCLDAIRYGLMSHLYGRSEQKIDWDKEFRKARYGEPDLPPFFRDGGLRGF